MYETGAPPPPPPLPQPGPVVVDEQYQHDLLQPARPARTYDAVTAVLPGQPPGTTTYRLRATETSQDG